MAKDSSNNSKAPTTMEELLASQTKKPLTVWRGQEVEGELIAINEKEITLDIGAKSEGIIASREFPSEKLSILKIGDKLTAYVSLPENESGQIILSLQKQTTPLKTVTKGRFKGKRVIDWSKFSAAESQKTKLQGKITEVNKGGLMVEVSGTRGFLPNSQVGFELLSKSGEGLDNLIGQDLTVTVIEVSPESNKLIFSERGQISEETLAALKEFKNGQRVSGKVVAILPFGLVVSVQGGASSKVEGLVFASDVSWEKVDDLSSQFKVGQELEAAVIGIDSELGRLNLSLKQLSEDPFLKIAEKYPVDEVVKGTVTSVSDKGVVVKLEDGVEGFLPSSKISPEASYSEGSEITALVDSVDTQKRRVNLAPFVTSTAGLIYK